MTRRSRPRRLRAVAKGCSSIQCCARAELTFRVLHATREVVSHLVDELAHAGIVKHGKDALQACDLIVAPAMHSRTTATSAVAFPSLSG
jgi:hypothetical protein